MDKLCVIEDLQPYQQMLEASPCGMMLLSRSGEIILVNAPLERMSGYSRKELIGRPARTLVAESLRPTFLPSVDRLPSVSHLGMLTKDGCEFPAEVRFNSLDLDNEKLIVASISDLSHLQTLNMERQKFVSLADNSLEFIGMCDRDFQPFYVNAAGMSLVGLDNLKEACRTKVRDFFFPEDQAFIEQKFFPQVLRDGHGEIEIRFRHFKTGRAVWMIYNVFNLKDAEGQVIGWATVSRDITERKHSQERFELVVESAPNAMVMVDGEKIKLVNKAAERLFGYSRTELLAMNIDALVPRRFQAGHAKNREEYAKHPRVHVMGAGRELSALTKSGREVPVEISLTPVEFADGKCFLASVIDITQKKALEEKSRAFARQLELEVEKRTKELNEQRIMALNSMHDAQEARQRAVAAEERFRMMVEGVKDYAIFLLDVDGHIVTWNLGAERFKGYKAQEIIGRHFSTFYPREDINAAKPARALQIAQNNGIYEEQGIRIRKDGSRFWAQVLITALKDEGGRLRGFSKITKDITFLKELEEKDRRANKLIFDQKFALDQHAIVAITDVAGKLIYANDKFCEISQYSRDELMGQDHRLLNSGYHTSEFMGELWTTIAEGRVWKGEIRNRAKDGSFYWGDVTIVPFLDEHNKPYQYLTICTDISSQKRLQKQLSELNSELKRSNTELEQFAYVASHDLQEPLRMVASFCKKLEKGYKDKLDEDAREYIHFAVDGAIRMQGLVDALLSYARAGRKEVERKPVDLNKVVASVLRDLNLVIQEKSATIEVGELPSLVANESQMMQLFQNFISNALKFHGPNPPVVKIAAHKRGGLWEFTVSDNGIGIDEQYFATIFVIFQRLHQRGQYPGTGIGLALCKKIVENYDGKISVLSKVGEGTSFSFTLKTKEIGHGEGHRHSAGGG